MMTKISVRNLLVKVEEIAAEEPMYRMGHDGSDGYCDCVGLIIGAIRRCGGQWRGLHGSNYAARKEIAGKLEPIIGTGGLQPGEVVLKAYEPGQGGYNLPEKYWPRGEYSTGDLRDYYHIGIIESVYPLRIRHMTSPRARMDDRIGKWGWHGKLSKVDYTETGEKKMDEVIIAGGNQDAPVHMRKAASTKSEIITDIPQGSQAKLIEGAGAWNLIEWNGKTGYVMSMFVNRKLIPEEDTISVSRAELTKLYDALGNVLGLRG